MALGTVKWFNDSKGYGFISRQPDGALDGLDPFSQIRDGSACPVLLGGTKCPDLDSLEATEHLLAALAAVDRAHGPFPITVALVPAPMAFVRSSADATRS